jgi:hypothetical protein
MRIVSGNKTAGFWQLHKNTNRIIFDPIVLPVIPIFVTTDYYPPLRLRVHKISVNYCEELVQYYKVKQP